VDKSRRHERPERRVVISRYSGRLSLWVQLQRELHSYWLGWHCVEWSALLVARIMVNWIN